MIGLALVWEKDGEWHVIDFEGEHAQGIAVGCAIGMAEGKERTNVRIMEIELPPLTPAMEAKIALAGKRIRESMAFSEAAYG